MVNFKPSCFKTMFSGNIAVCVVAILNLQLCSSLPSYMKKYQTTSGGYVYVKTLFSNFNMTEYFQNDINKVLLVFMFLFGITLFR